MASPLSARAALGEPQHPASISPATTAQWPCTHLTLGAGVAIFHIASARVVLCYHTRGGYWFLPKGRRDVHEHSVRGAEREGYEESGYRNRVLPLPLAHRQPTPAGQKQEGTAIFVTEPVWTMLMPVANGTKQYLLFWYIAETLPPDAEEALDAAQVGHGASGAVEAETEAEVAAAAAAYQAPPIYPTDLSLKERIAQEPAGYEPRRHADTGVDAEEAQYASFLVTVPEALEKLQGTVLADVVRRGWEAIELRGRIEEGSVSVKYSRGQLSVLDKSTGEATLRE